MAAFDLPPLRSSLPAADIQSFFQAVNAGLAVYMRSEGKPPDGSSPTLVHTFPKERLAITDQPFDVITYQVLSAEMAPTSNDGNRVPRAPALRGGTPVPHPHLAGYSLLTFGWWELATVEFQVWSRSNTIADQLTPWFHKFMMKYAFAYDYFQARGINYFRFVGRGPDKFDTSFQQELYLRTLQYQIRYETLDSALQRDVTRVSLNVSPQGSSETETIQLPSIPVRS